MMDEAVTTSAADKPTTGQRRPRICFVSPNIYPVLDPSQKIEKTGGAEVQQMCLGKAFAECGYSVHYVTRDFGQPDPCQIGDFMIHKTCSRSDGIPGIRFIYPRVPSLWRALERADADIYYVRGAGYPVGLVARFAKSRGRRAVFAVAHDGDVDPRIRRLPTRRDQWLYRYGIHNVDAIVVQSEHQAKLLQSNYGKKGYLIRNAWPLNDNPGIQAKRDIILWVAMFRDIKQPEHFVRLAASMPDLHFVMIGGPHLGSETAYREILKKSQDMKNLEVVGFKTLSETGEYYRRALALVNTSSHEGFPNTFLQAWSEGIPVVSYVDPDGLIKNNELGGVARGEHELPAVLRNVLNTKGTCCSSIKEYYLNNHSPQGAVSKYASLFNDLNIQAKLVDEPDTAP